jgi:hypothetical protein
MTRSVSIMHHRSIANSVVSTHWLFEAVGPRTQTPAHFPVPLPLEYAAVRSAPPRRFRRST